jgi:hypothetical protein
MTSFGTIKTKIEKLFESTYGKPEFKDHIKSFNKMVLENKNVSEIYFIYDELSSNKGLSKDIVDEYISESFEQLRDLINNNQNKIDLLSSWVNELVLEDTNNYNDIDLQVYTKNVTKNLESLLESKNRIRKTLLCSKEKEISESTLNIPISSMLQIATKTFNKEFSTLNEEEKKEFKFFTSLNETELKDEINKSKTLVCEKLNLSLNESSDSELREKIQKTLDKINETDYTLTSLYKLKQLEKGL